MIPDLIIVLGPTASGKTSIAVQLAFQINGEIISADSRQVYREMDIGTGKDLEEYWIDETEIPYYLINIKDPGYKYNVFEFQKDFSTAFSNIVDRDKTPLLVGGTGLYIESIVNQYKLINVPENTALRTELAHKDHEELSQLLKNINPNLHNTTDLTNKKRTIRAIEIAQYSIEHPTKNNLLPQLNPIILGVNVDRETRRKRITSRLHSRINEGMIEEVEGLLLKLSPVQLIFYGLEYKYITLYLTGKLSKDEMLKQLEIAIHQFAKRQMTWFRKMERSGIEISWIDGLASMEEKVDQAMKIIDQKKAAR